jgi:hypothetical protein
MPSGPRIRCASGDPAAMQRKHRNNSQRAFPLASVNSDIASREATPPPDPGRQSSMLRTGAVSTGYADRPVCRAGRASGAHLWSPDRRSRADQLEATLTFIQRRSEMKALWCGATALTLVAAVSLSSAMAQGPKPSGGNTWPGISQRVVPSSSTAEECGSGRLWVSPGYASRGKWRPAHCASDTQISAETGPKSSYGYTKSAGFAGFSGPPPSGGQR